MKWRWLVCWKRLRPVGMVVRGVYIPPFAEARRMGHPGFVRRVECGKAGTGGCWRFASHPSQKARRMGHPGFCGGVSVKRRGLGGAGGLHPTLRRSAKDGAPEVFGLVRVERRFLS